MATKGSLKKYVDLKNYNNTAGQMRQVGKDVFDIIGDALFEIYDSQELVYTFLTKIKQVKDTVKNDPASITEAIEKVIDVLRLNGSKSSIRSLSTGKTLKSDFDSTDSFNFFIYGLKTPPASHLAILSSNVKQHLDELTDLINRYETEEPLIKKMISESRMPSSHEERVRWDFYQRCLSEQKKILHYYLKEMKDRAIAKSVEELYARYGFSGSLGFLEFRDYPYQFGHFYYLERFDYRHINESAHRNAELPIGGTYEKLEKLYKQDKAKYYRLYFSIRKKATILKNIEETLSEIPLARNRIPIFDELERLFKGRRWIAFYALALPQIEGLFTDMLEIARNDNKKKASLSEKVLHAREFDYHDGMYFDYFEYHVPRLRNKFMHTGYDEDFELKAYDVLTDLEFLLSAFDKLKAPWIKLHKLYEKKDPNDFSSFQQIVDYLKMLWHLIEGYQPRYTENRAMIETFNRTFLAGDCNVFSTIGERLPVIDRNVADCTVSFEYHFVKGDTLEMFNMLPIPEINKLMETDGFPSLFKRFLLYSHDKIEDLENLKLIHKSLKLFGQGKTGEKTKIITPFWNKHRVFVEKIILLKKELMEMKSYGDL